MRIFVSVLLIFCFIPIVFASSVEQAGFIVGVQTKTHFSHSGTETDTVVWTPESGRKIVLMGMAFSSDVAERVLVESGTTVVIPYMQNVASGLTVVDSGYPIWEGTTDATLTYTTVVAGDHSILLWGYESQ